jgi:hypothetical protein
MHGWKALGLEACQPRERAGQLANANRATGQDGLKVGSSAEFHTTLERGGRLTWGLKPIRKGWLFYTRAAPYVALGADFPP